MHAVLGKVWFVWVTFKSLSADVVRDLIIDKSCTLLTEMIWQDLGHNRAVHILGRLVDGLLSIETCRLTEKLMAGNRHLKNVLVVPIGDAVDHGAVSAVRCSHRHGGGGIATRNRRVSVIWVKSGTEGQSRVWLLLCRAG